MSGQPWPQRYPELAEYFGVADELSDPETALEDLDPRNVAYARDAAQAHKLPWPPAMTYEDDVRNEVARCDRVQRALQVPTDPYEGLESL